MRRLVLVLAVATLAAADPSPAAFIPADADLAVQLPELARSRIRWQRTPYPRLLDSGWGRVLVGEWSRRLEELAPGAGAALTAVQSLALTARGAPDDPQITLAATAGAVLPPLLAFLWPEELPGTPGTHGTPGGRLTMHGQVAAWASGPGGAVTPGRAPPPPPPAPDADAGVRLIPGRWLPTAVGEVRVDLQLDAVGLRESASLAPTAATRVAAAAPRTWADPQELRRLPATTLWAATWQGDPALAASLPGPEAQSLATIEAWMSDNGLPGWHETIAACSGPSTVWMAEGVPFPAFGAAISLPEAVAKRWIAAAAAKLNLAVTPQGAAGFIGLVPVAVGWIAEGRLIITTDPQGVAGWKLFKPGFAESRGVGEVLAKVPPRTLLLGAGRGGASWATLAQLSVPMFLAMGAPQTVSLPGDLRLAGDRGWLYLRLLEDGTLRSEAGGLFGGPFTTVAASGIATSATLWLQQQLQREARQKQVEKPAPEPAPATPVF